MTPPWLDEAVESAKTASARNKMHGMARGEYWNQENIVLEPDQLLALAEVIKAVREEREDRRRDWRGESYVIPKSQVALALLDQVGRPSPF